jgi:8-amino-7-oxononanoate synthase
MDAIEKFLAQREEDGLLRILRPADLRGGGKIHFGGKKFFDFSSNDYLGLSNHPRLREAAEKAIENLGVSASASRLLSGDLKIFHKLEEKVAKFKGKEAALVFNSGFQANVGAISALYGRGDAIFCDRLSHASIIDGITLSGAKLFRFKHNDLEHLKSLLKKNADKFKNNLIATETIFSMDGDKCPLKELVEIKNKFGCRLLVDEAHATGIFGISGGGIVEQEGLSLDVDLIMGTFSKALGSFGAYLACDEKIKQYLINTCRSFIYSTALPPAVIAAGIEALNIIRDEPQRRQTLLANVDYFREKLQTAGLDVRGSSQIIPLIIGDAEKAVEISELLRRNGYWVLPIRPPTVPANESRLRFSLSFDHDKKVLQKLAQRIIEILK